MLVLLFLPHQEGLFFWVLLGGGLGWGYPDQRSTSPMALMPPGSTTKP